MQNIITTRGPTVKLPDNSVITADKKGELPLHHTLSIDAREANIIPKLSSSSLISLGQLCDDDCNIILHKKVLLAVKNDEIVLKGYRNYNDGLWDIPVAKCTIAPTNYPSPPTHAGMYKSKEKPTRPQAIKQQKDKRE